MNTTTFIQVRHTIPRRIRYKIPEMQSDLNLSNDESGGLAYVLSLREEADGEPLPFCIKETKLNMFTRSVIIQYDPKVIEPKKQHEALTSEDEVRFRELAAELDTVMAT